MTTFQLVSDIHLEFNANNRYFSENEFEQIADNLILAGDICLFNDPNLEPFLNSVSKKFKNVIYVPGNHEFYNSSLIQNYYNSYKRTNGNVHIINNESILVDNTLVIGSTLWGFAKPENISLVNNGMNDYHVIKFFDEGGSRRLSCVDTNKYNELSSNYIKATLDKSDTECMIVTHHLPLPETLGDKYVGSRLNDAYASDQYETIAKYSDKIRCWAHGHSHDKFDKELHGVRIVRNPFGYMIRNEHSNFAHKEI